MPMRPRSADGSTASANVHTNVTPSCNNPKLSYFGGPVVSNPVVVPVYWNSDVNAEIVQKMPQFLSDVTNSSYWGAVAEYGTVGLTPGSDQVIGTGSSTMGYTLSPTKCPAGTNRCTVSDAQLQTELTEDITAGILPAETLDAQGNPNTIYMVFFPPLVSLTAPDNSGTSCVQFCAYHNTGTIGTNNTPLLYGAIMDDYSGACSNGCGESSTPFENESSVTSHELVEAVTDADIGLLPATASAAVAPAAWYDNNNNCGEIMDICDNGLNGDTITVDGRSWIVQEMWSNWQNKCTSVEGLTYILSPPTAAATGAPVTFTVYSPSSAYRGTVTFSSTDPLAVLPANYTFTTADAGAHSFQATFNSAGTETIVAHDANASLITGSSTYTVTQTATPAALISPTPGLGTKLGSPSVTFQWTTGADVTLYQLNVSAVSPGASDLFLYKGSATSATANALPANGDEVYARLYSKINGVWQFNDYVYTESGSHAAALTSPTPGSNTILGTSSVLFQWTTGIGVADYQLNLSAVAAGSSELYTYKGTATSAIVPTLPANGVEVYARLYSKINGIWRYNDYVYTESGTPTPATLTSPTPGLSTILGTSNLLFQWAAGSPASTYQLNLSAITPGASDLFLYKGTALSATVTTLPAHGVTVYATLYSKIDGVWLSNAYVFTESGIPTPAALTSPTPGLGTILGTNNVLFQWSAGTSASLYQLNLSAVAPGKSELYLYKGTALSATAPTLPANGVTIYARLYSKIDGNWLYNDYVYTEQ